MTRLIDADELKKEFPHNSDWMYPVNTNEYVCYVIDAQPTVDAVPVRHGKWINMGDFEQCSVCTATHLKTVQTVYGEATWIKSDYCPSCGARMDAERKEE